MLQSIEDFFSSSHDFVFLIDRNYRYHQVNNAFLKLCNKNRDEIIGKTIAELVGKDLFEKNIKSNIDLCLKDNTVNFREWLELKSIGRRFLDITFSPSRDNRNRISAVIANGRDITEMTLSLKALQENEQRLEGLVEAGNIGIWDWDLRSNLVDFSKKWKNQIGYDDSEISNDYLEWQNRVHPNDLASAKAKVAAFLEHPWPDYVNEYRFRHKDGSYRWIMATASLQHDEEGRPKRMMGGHVDITRRKEKEEALRLNEEMLRKAHQVARIASWWYDPKTMTHGWTDEMFQTFGLEQGLQQSDFLEYKKYIHPDDWEKFFKCINRAVKIGRGFDLEMRLIRQDGGIHYVNSICEPIKGEDGTIAILIGTLQDITDRKLTEEASRASQKQYSNLFESIRDAILVLDTNRVIINCNQAVVDIFGYEKNQLLGHNTEFLYESKRQFEETGALIRKHFGEKNFLFTTEFKKKSGEIFLGETSLFYLKNSSGEVHGFIGLIRDISERLENEKLLRKSEARFRSMVENLFDAIVVINDEGLIRFANYAACALFDRSLKELVGSTIGFPLSVAAIHHIDIIQKGGTVRYAEIKFSSADWENETVYLASIRDTTNSVLARLERLKHQENLQQLQRLEAIGSLAGGIAHDFNNILTPILGFTELARERIKDDEIAEDCMQEVYTSALRARELVGQILAFSRQGKEAYRPILMKSTVREGLRLIRSTIPSSITIRQHIQSKGMIIGDETEIHQILMNLCTNAHHAMADGGGEIDVSLVDMKIAEGEVSLRPRLHPGRYIHLRIEDSGCGMKQSVMEKIFEPYFSTKERDKGTGLGLSIVHGIIHKHNGVITVDSKLHQGTVFDVYLPSSFSRKKIEIETEMEPKEGNGRILVVDDESAILKLNAKVLESLGYTVTSMIDSVEALRLFETQLETFDLLLTDMTMPGITGDKLAEKCIKIKPDLPVILITGFSEKITEVQAKRIGITSFLHKPITKNQMAHAVNSALQHKNPGTGSGEIAYIDMT